ncbi:MAG: hypothetical protein FWD52_08240 [Candidatus Bathyarchaeota archaeon]|nr:hypothetical protein [Candidatus Termiticorpusculum sp.]
MSGFPRTPRTLKGAIVVLDTPSSTPRFIKFQYNPDSITRNLTPKYTKVEGDNSETFRLNGSPDEELSVDIEFDATDDLEHPKQNSVAVGLGISPQLAMLEAILYPSSDQVAANESLAKLGKMEIVPPMGSLILFAFGVNKILPVAIKSYSITEEAYDNMLNPIRAKVKITMNALGQSVLQSSQIAYALYSVNNIAKEVLSTISQHTATVTATAAVGFTKKLI